MTMIVSGMIFWMVAAKMCSAVCSRPWCGSILCGISEHLYICV